MRFAKLCLLLVALSGCGGGSQVSPVVEYNAALEALKDRDATLEATNKLLRDPSLKPEQRKKFEDNKRNLESTIEKLEQRAKDAKARL